MSMRTILFTVLTAVVGFVAGIVTSDFVEYRSDTRERLGAEIETYSETTKQLDNVLSQFAAIAAGERPATDKDLAGLRDSLLGFQREARKVFQRLPAIETQYDRLDSAIESVAEASSNIATPDKNKPFVAAVVNLLEAADDFQQSALELQGRYTTGLWG